MLPVNETNNALLNPHHTQSKLDRRLAFDWWKTWRALVSILMAGTAVMLERHCDSLELKATGFAIPPMIVPFRPLEDLMAFVLPSNHALQTSTDKTKAILHPIMITNDLVLHPIPSNLVNPAN
jgi:hypothetical protein